MADYSTPKSENRASRQASSILRRDRPARDARGTWGWVARAALVLALATILVGSFASAFPRLSGGSDVALAATILGMSIVFASVLAPCVFLIFSWRWSVTGIIEEAQEVERKVDRGLELAASIKRTFAENSSRRR